MTKLLIKTSASYVMIGLFTTLLTILLWNALIWLGNKISPASNSLLISTSFYMAAFVMILPSFYLNRKITFKDLDTKHGRYKTIFKAYSIYIISPLIATVVIFMLQSAFDFESSNISLALFGKSFDLKYGRLFLQLLAIFLSMCGNFIGQKYWLYKNRQ